MKSEHLEQLTSLLRRQAGLDLGRGGMGANLERVVGDRLAAEGLLFEEYMARLNAPGSSEMKLLLEAMTVVYTWFFRDPGQFRVLEELLQQNHTGSPLGIWVAGCATGEEPYSVALLADRCGRSVEILATDLNSGALRHATEGRYTASSLNAVDADMRTRYLGERPGDYVVPEHVRRAVRFQVRNLMDPPPQPPSPRGWDLILCRNVLIYFGREPARRTLDAMAASLAPGGHMMLGASEAILEQPSSLHVVGVAGRAVLQRPGPRTLQPVRPRWELEQPRELPRFPRTPSPPAPVQALPLLRTPNPIPPMQALPPRGSSRPPTPSPSEAAIEAGRAALDAGDVGAARDSFAMAVALEPTSAEALMFGGITSYLHGDLPDALRQLRGALCLDGSLWAACFYQALCFENMGYAEDAARSYAQVLRLTSDVQAGREEGVGFLAAWRADLLAIANKRAGQPRAG